MPLVRWLGAAWKLRLSRILRHRLAHPAPLTRTAGVSFFLSSLLLFASLSFFTLTALSTVRASVVYVLPSHRSSTFTPLWFSFLSILASFLSIVSYSKPRFFPISTSAIFNGASAVFAVVSLILVGAVSDLRENEGLLTIIVIAVSFATFVQCAVRHVCCDPFASAMPCVAFARVTC